MTEPTSSRPKKLICTLYTPMVHHSHNTNHSIRNAVAPGDIEAAPDLKTTTTHHHSKEEEKQQDPHSDTSTPDSTTETELVAHPARAHQFVSNPPLTISQIHPHNPLHQFNGWFRDHRLPPSSAPETCTLATASLPEGRVSARMVYLKELDERGWVVYSNWGSREGKGGQVFGGHADGEGVLGAMPRPGAGGSAGGDENLQADLAQTGNKWAALTFCWSTVERQVRIEGLIEPLSHEESEMYWRTRERDSQIGAWASWQSKVLWSAEPGTLDEHHRRRSSSAGNDPSASASTSTCPDIPADVEETDIEDGRAMLEQRVNEMKARFADTQEIPLPPYWGGVRLVPESVEFWQGRQSRLHDRFRYVRVHGDGKDSSYRWRIQRLSP